MRAKSSFLLLLLFLLGAAGCTQQSSGEGGALANEGRPPVAVEVAAASPAEMVESIEVVGTLTPKFQVDVKTEYTGIVTQVYVTEWVRVQRGTPLAKLDSREDEAAVAAAQAALMQAQVNRERSDREYERMLKLKGVGLATQQNVDDARTAKDAAEASQAAAQAQLRAVQARLEKLLIRAPMSGVIAERLVNVGDLVENMGSPRPLFRIVDNRLLELTLTVPTAKLAALRVGQPLTFRTEAFPGRTFEGKLKYINAATEEVSRTVKVIAEVPNPKEELKAGLFAEGAIITGRRTSVLQVPRSALLTWDVVKQEGVVFVVNGEKAGRRAVQTGKAAGAAVEITGGLTAGETVVTAGAFNLQDGDRVRVLPRKGA
jgi:RND family efflux transporter MFP subunit